MTNDSDSNADRGTGLPIELVTALLVARDVLLMVAVLGKDDERAGRQAGSILETVVSADRGKGTKTLTEAAHVLDRVINKDFDQYLKDNFNVKTG